MKSLKTKKSMLLALVSINKIYPHILDTIVLKTIFFPINTVIREGTTVYMNIPKQEITQENIDVLSRYDAIDLDWRNVSIIYL